MTYHFPIFKGDRVALAPHLNLWMQGVRFGTVDKVAQNVHGATIYRIAAGDTLLWYAADDLLGAVRTGLVPETEAQTIPYCPVRKMQKGDRFLTNRSGMVTAVSDPYPDNVWNWSSTDVWCIDVRKADGTILGIVGLQPYRVDRPVRSRTVQTETTGADK